MGTFMRAPLFVLLLFSGQVAFGIESDGVSPSREATSPVASPVTDADAEEFADAGGPLFLLALLTVWALVALFVFGLGIIAGLALCAAIGLLIALGILSTSALVALLRRNPADGLRVLFLQVSAVVGAVLGIAAAWLAPHVAELRLQVSSTIVIGALAGALCGAVLGGLFNYAWGRATTVIVKRFETT